MKYTDNRTDGVITFEDIPQGELFMYEEDLYMKTSSVEEINYGVVNAVDVSSGELQCFDDNEEIERVRASLTITNW